MWHTQFIVMSICFDTIWQFTLLFCRDFWSLKSADTNHLGDDIILLIDSNGKYINTAKFSLNKKTWQLFSPTIPLGIRTPSDSNFGQLPSHIIIHVGTKDIEPAHAALHSYLTNLQNTVQMASQKIVTSSLLKHIDDLDNFRSDFNLNCSKLPSFCAPFPNAHRVNNDNYLHILNISNGYKVRCLGCKLQRCHIQQDKIY